MNRLSLIRADHQPKQTLGTLFVLDENDNILFECFTLELPWKNNSRRVSCIPDGTYRVVPRWSQKYGQHLHILDVPGRDLILIHEANFVRQLQGCIAVGSSLMDIDGDGLTDVTHSINTKMKLNQFIRQETTIEIR